MHKINLEDQNPPTPTTDEPAVAKDELPLVEEKVKTPVDEPKTSDNNEISVKPSLPKLTLILSIVVVAAGVATGFGGYKLQHKSGNLLPRPSELQRVAEEGQIQAGDIFGVTDEKTFKDTAAGYLEEGEASDEGSHKLLRPGGVSQTVHLTSSITDLDQFIGMEIKVWGETFKGQRAGWLMDVGRIEVVEPSGVSPSEE